MNIEIIEINGITKENELVIAKKIIDCMSRGDLQELLKNNNIPGRSKIYTDLGISFYCSKEYQRLMISDNVTHDNKVLAESEFEANRNQLIVSKILPYISAESIIKFVLEKGYRIEYALQNIVRLEIIFKLKTYRDKEIEENNKKTPNKDNGEYLLFGNIDT